MARVLFSFPVAVEKLILRFKIEKGLLTRDISSELYRILKEYKTISRNKFSK